MSIKRIFAVNNSYIIGHYSHSQLKLYVHKKELELACCKAIESAILDYWIVKEQSYTLNISKSFRNEVSIPLEINDFKALKVSGDYIYVVSSTGIYIYSLVGVLMKRLEISYALQQVSLAFDAFERLVGFSTDETLVVKKDGIQGVVSSVLNDIYQSAVSNDLISKEQGWVLIKDVKKGIDYAHWKAHSTTVLKISFSSSGQKVITSTLGSNSFCVWDMVNVTDQQPDLLYILSRGFTPASVYDISWTRDDTWISVSTSHGTSHLYFLDPLNLNTKKSVSAQTRIKRPVDQDRHTYLAFFTAFMYPLEIVDDGIQLSLLTFLANDVITIDIFEISGNIFDMKRIKLVDSKKIEMNGEESMSEFSNLSEEMFMENPPPNSWHSLVSIESYQTQPFWSLNHVSFSTFEDGIPSLPFKKHSPDLSNLPGTRPFSMIESIAVPNGATSTTSQYPVVSWKEEKLDSLKGAIEIVLDKKEASILNPRVDQHRRNDLNFDDEWTVQVDGVQMEDVI